MSTDIASTQLNRTASVTIVIDGKTIINHDYVIYPGTNSVSFVLDHIERIFRELATNNNKGIKT